MAIGNYRGRAKVDPRSPRAQAECDRCGFWWNRSDLKVQMQWAGTQLIDLGFRVCRNCLDIPQEQFRTIILPPDPLPVPDPRPSKDGSQS